MAFHDVFNHRRTRMHTDIIKADFMFSYSCLC
jgi:hypothetical protein